MSLFKRAYVRGINDEMIRLGLVRYPTKEAADEVADAIGDQMMPEPAAEAVPAETAADVAATLVDAANTLVESTGMGEEVAEPEEALKTSAAEDFETRATKQAEAVMLKAAEEQKHAVGSTIEGGDKGNTMTDTPAAETQMEAANRPQGMHHLGQGNTMLNTGPGAVGEEQVPAPKAPAETDAGSNSAIEQSKAGSLRKIIQKIAAGSTIEGGDKGNTMAEAPAAETQMEAANRPEGYAENSRGETELPVTPAAVVGTEQPQPEAPAESPAGTNSAIEMSNKAAAEDPFLTLFKKTAEEVASHLPQGMTEDQKIAHIRQMMGMNADERNQYVGLLHKEAGATDDEAVDAVQKHAEAACKRSRYENPYGRKRMDRTKANQKTAQTEDQKDKLPEALVNAIEKKEGKGNGAEEEAKSKKEDAKEDKAEYDEAKEGMDLLSRIRQISQSVSA